MRITSLIFFRVALALVFFESSIWILIALAGFLGLFFLFNQHLTIIIVQLEIIALITISVLSWKITQGDLELSIVFRLIVLRVIEASIGLALLVKLSRSSGPELLKFKF